MIYETSAATEENSKTSVYISNVDINLTITKGAYSKTNSKKSHALYEEYIKFRKDASDFLLNLNSKKSDQANNPVW